MMNGCIKSLRIAKEHERNPERLFRMNVKNELAILNVISVCVPECLKCFD